MLQVQRRNPGGEPRSRVQLIPPSLHEGPGFLGILTLLETKNPGGEPRSQVQLIPASLHEGPGLLGILTLIATKNPVVYVPHFVSLS